MEPIIVEYDSLKFVGLTAVIRRSLHSRNDLSKVPVLWKELMPLVSGLPSRRGQERYALISGDLGIERGGEASYSAMVAVENFDHVPKPLVTFEFSKVRMAKFPHKGPPEMVGATVLEFVSEWLPESGQVIAESLELFIYPPDYDRDDPEGVFDCCIFLETLAPKISG